MIAGHANAQDTTYADIGAAIGSSNSTGFAYEFTQNDLDQIQQILNQLRNLLSSTDAISPEHRDRVLKKFERLQRELHKRTPTLRNVRDTILELGLLAQAAEEAGQPILRLTWQLAQVISAVQRSAFGLPPSTNYDLFLPEPPDSADNDSN